MGWLKFAAVVMCVWGTTSYAALPDDAVGGERRELQTISSWMAHINHHYPGVDVTWVQAPQGPAARAFLLFQLHVLEAVLRGETTAPSGALMHLTCANIVCGGGGSGSSGSGR